MGEFNGAGAPVRFVLVASCGIAALGVGVASLAYSIDRFALGPGTTELAHWTALLVAMASGLFLAAGMMRLVKWRLVHDAHSALVGTALIVMGGLCLPLGGFARVFAADNSSFVGATTRGVASFAAMWLVLRALHTTEVPPSNRPARLLPRLFVGILLVFAVLVNLDPALPGRIANDTLVATTRTALLSMGWFAVAVRAGLRSDVLPWAGRAAPLYLGMGIAEMLRGIDLAQVNTWTFCGMLLCTSMAALAARSALSDLDAAVRDDEQELGDLSGALVRANVEAEALTDWREQLTHDARNVVAGLRAAMDILEQYDGRLDALANQRLRLAAMAEIGHLEHLLTRSESQPCEVFDAEEVVRQVGECARALGAPVSVRATRALCHGRPGDLAAVLKQLLVNAATHAPGSEVELTVVATTGGSVRIHCTDDGPGLSPSIAARVFERGYRSVTSPGSGLGLSAARELMREQGGDLELGRSARGATFHLTLPATAATPGPVRVTVPAQRSLATVRQAAPASPATAGPR